MDIHKQRCTYLSDKQGSSTWSLCTYRTFWTEALHFLFCSTMYIHTLYIYIYIYINSFQDIYASHPTRLFHPPTCFTCIITNFCKLGQLMLAHLSTTITGPVSLVSSSSYDWGEALNLKSNEVQDCFGCGFLTSIFTFM